jgi:hypothetical protein
MPVIRELPATPSRTLPATAPTRPRTAVGWDAEGAIGGDAGMEKSSPVALIRG